MVVEVIPPEAKESDFNFEKAFDSCVCHLFRGISSRSLCKQISREEQPVHGDILPDKVWAKTVFCPFCGTEKCHSCRAVVERHA